MNVHFDMFLYNSTGYFRLRWIIEHPDTNKGGERDAPRSKQYAREDKHIFNKYTRTVLP